MTKSVACKEKACTSRFVVKCYDIGHWYNHWLSSNMQMGVLVNQYHDPVDNQCSKKKKKKKNARVIVHETEINQKRKNRT